MAETLDNNNSNRIRIEKEWRMKEENETKERRQELRTRRTSHQGNWKFSWITTRRSETPLGLGRNLGGRRCLQTTWLMTLFTAGRTTIPSILSLKRLKEEMGSWTPEGPFRKTAAFSLPVCSFILGGQLWNAGEAGARKPEFRGGRFPDLTKIRCWVRFSRTRTTS